MYQERKGLQLIELDGLLYAICGYKDNTMDVYNPDTDEWTMLASAHYQHSWFGATVHEGKIYVCSDAGFEMYSPDSDTWETLTPLVKPYKYCDGRSLVSVNGKLWAIGGCYNNSFIGNASVYEFDTSTGVWTQLPDMDVARGRHCSFVLKA